MFKNSLFKKIFFIFFLSTLVILSVFAFQASNLQKESIVESLHSQARSMSDAITFFNTDNMMANDDTAILEFSYKYVQSNPHIIKLVFSRENRDDLVIRSKSWSLQTKQKDLKQYESYSEKYQIREMDGQDVFYYSYPVKLSSVTWGWIHMALSLDEYEQKIMMMYEKFFYMAALFLIMTVVLAYVIAQLISRPIIKLNKVSQEIADGDMTRRVDISSNDEIENLARNFNRMVDSLAATHQELKHSNDELEHRVLLRTSELVQVNEQLEHKTLQLKDLNDNLEQCVLEEIKKRKDQEEMLIQQSKLAAMGEMIGNIAHQWRQPLNALGLVIQNIEFSHENGILDDETMERAAKKANLLTQSMSKTIDDFRNFFKPNKEMAPFSLNDALTQSLYLVEGSFASSGIKIIQELENTPDVYGFFNEFTQALLNILNNAKDALLENEINPAKINICIKSNATHGYVIISDNANGIPVDILDKVFDPYFTTKEEGKGTGIGLYMSKIIIEKNMDGQLLVQNTDNGAEFVMKIPLHKKGKSA